MIQQPIKLYPYVEIILGKTRVSTDCCQTVTHGSATFERSHVCIMLPVSDYLCRGGETRKMTLRVFNRRWGVSLRGDPLIGEVELPIDMSRACGQESFVCVPISRRGRPHGQILVKYSVASAAESAYEDKLHETGQHSVSEVAEALAQVLQGKNGLNIVRAALPKELVPPQTNAQPGHSSHDPLQALLVSLCNQASMLADESDDEVLERFGRLSRSIQDFVAKYASSGAEVTSLAKLWIRRIFNGCGSSKETLCMKSFLPQLNSLDEDRLRKFIENGKRFPGINDLAPIDRCGNEIKDWRLFAPDVPQLAILGEGSFGYVWRAKDTRSGEWYAVKNSRKPRSRFVQREIAVTDHVLMRPHPCIVQIFGTHYLDSVQRSSLIMEFCTGGDLLHEIQRWVLNSPGRYRPPLVAPFYLAQVILGLEHLHTKLDTLLRDLKPENVVLTHYGRSLRAKLTDFGLSRIGAESTGAWTLQAAPPGTAHYIAPEVVLQKRYGFQADLYSLGVLFWTVLTGGLVDSPGIPPCIRVEQHFAGFAPYKENWKLIRNCVRDPYSNGARPMPCAGSGDLVLKLTRENPQARLDYVALRKHPYTRQMSLPPADAQRDVIETWLQQYEEALALEETSTRLSADDAGAPSDTPDVAAGPDEFTLDLPVVMEESMIASDASTGEGGSSEVFSTANATAADNDA